MNSLELLDEYARQIEIDTQVDITNIMEKQLSAPGVKHKWLYKLTQSKKDLLRLIELKDSIMEKAIEANKIDLPITKIKAAIEKSSEVKELNKKIKEQELLVEYLDKCVDKIFSQMGFDFKNIVELMKMEQL